MPLRRKATLIFRFYFLRGLVTFPKGRNKVWQNITFETASIVFLILSVKCLFYTKVASSVILVLSNLLIGQLAFASAVAASNFALSIPGTFAFSTR